MGEPQAAPQADIALDAEGEGASGTPQSIAFCVVADYGGQKIFYAPLHALPGGAAIRFDRLSRRFIRSVNAQHQLDLDINRRVCGGSPTYRAASRALIRTMSPLLSQGYVAVEVGIF